MKQEEVLRKNVEETYRDNASVLQIRLNSDFVIERIRTYLTGKVQYVIYDDEGKPVEKVDEIAEPKANNKGIQEILNFVQNIINPQVVQGNFKFEQFQSYIDEVHESLILDLMNNLHEWEISEENYEPMINKIMVLVIPFISRLIGNKERDSYAQTIKAMESSSVHQGKFGLVGG